MVVLGIDRQGFLQAVARMHRSIILVIASFGLMLMIRSVIAVLPGAVQLKTILPGIQMPRMQLICDFLQFSRSKHIMFIVGGALLSDVSCVHYVLTYTKIGKAMRAMSDSPELGAADRHQYRDGW